LQIRINFEKGEFGMKSGDFKFLAQDKTEIFTYKWLPDDDKKIRAVFQIVHGMAEHAARYSEVADFLTKNGIAVYASDIRGHGKTAGSPDNMGFFAEKNGWDLVVNDKFELTQQIKRENPGLPVYLLGCSMGTLVIRDYILKYSDYINGVILSGTSCDPGILAYFGKLVAKWQIRQYGFKAKSPLLDKLSFGKFNSHFKPNRTPFDWLSVNEENVDRYIEDPYCGSIFSAGFFYDLIYGVKKVNLFKNIKKVSKNLPILIISGEKDPVGNFTKGVLKVFDYYKKAKITDLNLKFYSGFRHEILNETNRNEVYNDIMEWLNKRVEAVN
jgi:alpha-beta hydrolase superfamily lysophospholipase